MMKRILLLLTILLAAIPIKSHAVVIDTLWTKQIGIPSVSTIRFLNDSIALLPCRVDSSSKFAISFLNINTKTIEEKLHFQDGSSLSCDLEFSMDRNYILFLPGYEKDKIFTINANTMEIIDSLPFTNCSDFYISKKDSICYIALYDTTPASMDKFIEYNYISKKLISSHYLINPRINKLEDFVAVTDTTAIVYITELFNNDFNNYFYWINLKTFKKIRNIWDSDFNHDIKQSVSRIKVNPNGKNWSAIRNYRDYYMKEGQLDSECLIMSTEDDSVLYIIPDGDEILYFNSGNYLISESTGYYQIITAENPYTLTRIIDLNTMVPVYSRRENKYSFGFFDITPDDSKYLSLSNTQDYYNIPCLNQIDWTKTKIQNILGKPIMYPNPTNGVLRFDMIRNKMVYDKLVIYSLTGEKILEFIPDESKNEIDISALPKGVYFVNFISGAKIIASEQVIKK